MKQQYSNEGNNMADKLQVTVSHHDIQLLFYPATLTLSTRSASFLYIIFLHLNPLHHISMGGTKCTCCQASPRVAADTSTCRAILITDRAFELCTVWIRS